MNLLGFTMMAAVIACVLFGRKQVALMALMAGYLYITQNQGFDVFGFNLFAYRFIEVAGVVRIFAKKEFSFSQSTKIDWALLVLFSFTTVVFVIRSKDGFGYLIGTSIDFYLTYIIFRALITGIDDFKSFLKGFAVVMMPLALMLLMERRSGNDPFVGLENLVPTLMDRAGHPRCQGSFRHPSLLGTLGACFFPLYIALGLDKGERLWGIIGGLVCMEIVWTSKSGGPMSCLVVGFLCWGAWPFRKKLRLIRWGMVAALVILALTMKSPVWYVLARVSKFTGGDGWHRSYLLDIAFQNLDKWWLAGMPVLDTAGWFPYEAVATGGADITNEFLFFGLSAGLGAVVLFIRVLVIAFKMVGSALKRLEDQPTNEKYMVWALGAVLVVHISNWFGITYFDQTYAIFMLQFAALVNLSLSALAVPEESSDEVVADEFEPALDGGAPFASGSL